MTELEWVSVEVEAIHSDYDCVKQIGWIRKIT